MKSFTVDEIRTIFENIVVNSDKHGNSYYTQLNGETSTQDVGYFEQCMTCFLKDLQMIADGLYNTNGVKIADKNINDYNTVREALQSISDKYIKEICILEIDNKDRTSIKYITVDNYVRFILNEPHIYLYKYSYILSSNSYHIEYHEVNNKLFILIHVDEVQGN